MPIDLVVTYRDGRKELVYIPTNETLGSKAAEDPLIKQRELAPWAWVDPDYTFTLDVNPSDVLTVEIDPSLRMADVNRKNNKITVAEKLKDGQ